MLNLSKRLNSIKPEPDVLIVTKSRTRRTLEFAYLIVFCTIWYGVLLGFPKDLESVRNGIQDQVSSDPIVWLFLLLPLAMIVLQGLRDLKIILVGEQFVFDRIQDLVLKDHKVVANLHEIRRIQIRTIGGRKKNYLLTVVLKTEEKLKIDQNRNFEELCEVADDIADIAKVKVVHK